MSFRIFLAALLVAFAFKEETGFCYIPPSQFIVSTMAKKHSLTKGVRIKSRITRFQDGQADLLGFTETTIFNVKTGTLLSYAKDDRGQELFIVEKNWTNFFPPDSILFLSDGKAMSRVLLDRSIPVRTEEELLAMKSEEERYASEISSLAKINGAFAWVIGEKSKPQLWVGKDTFLPLRIIYPRPGEGTLIDVRFETQRFHGEFPYPRQISAWQDAKFLFKAELTEINVDPDLVEGKGSRAGHRNSGNSGSPGFTEAGKASSEEARKLIEQYYGILR